MQKRTSPDHNSIWFRAKIERRHGIDRAKILKGHFWRKIVASAETDEIQTIFPSGFAPKIERFAPNMKDSMGSTGQKSSRDIFGEKCSECRNGRDPDHNSIWFRAKIERRHGIDRAKILKGHFWRKKVASAETDEIQTNPAQEQTKARPFQFWFAPKRSDGL